MTMTLIVMQMEVGMDRLIQLMEKYKKKRKKKEIVAPVDKSVLPVYVKDNTAEHIALTMGPPNGVN